ncbi:MAG: type II toxin-antitoxin system RelE family toxin [Coriobacteriia bacterium]
MTTYGIEFAPSADRQFRKLDAETRRRLAPVIDGLATDPRPQSAKRLSATEHLYRVRCGAYRIVYAIEDDRLVVLVVALGHRRDVYRSL